ncbi:MAG: MBL fold metallo-hydrolase [Natronomonas sp.]
MKVSPGVFSYEVEWQYDEPLWVQVIETDQTTVLFGAGDESAADAVCDIATNHGVDALIVEHGDTDHYGGVPTLREAIEDLEVATPAGDVSFLEEAGIEVDRPLEAGERYWGVRTISTPGHTPDNMSYLYEDTLVAGDTVTGADSLFAAAGEWSGPLAVITADYNADDEQARNSVSELAEYEFETVLVSHGTNVTEDGSEKIETLVADLD